MKRFWLWVIPAVVAIAAAVLVYGYSFASERGVLELDDGGRYEGVIRDGKAHGEGVMTWANGDRYEGEFREGKRHGQGVLTVPQRLTSEGAWGTDGYKCRRPINEPNSPCSETILEFYLVTMGKGGRYEGEWRDDKPHGQGVFSGAGIDEMRYEGEFRAGNFHGQGVQQIKHVSLFGSMSVRYEGEFRDGLPHGQGVSAFSDGSRYEGEFRAGTFHGQGVYTGEGRRIEGEWRNGEPPGG